LKNSKNWDFSKQVSPWFRSKIKIFPDFYFRGNSKERCVLLFSGRKACLDFQNKKLKKYKKIGIFSKGWVYGFGEKLVFLQIFILRKISQKNVSYHFLEGKKACLDYKNKKLKKSKIGDFFKGVSPWFRSKIGNFSRF